MKISKYLTNPYTLFAPLAQRGLFKHMDDKKYLQLLYYSTVGKKLNLNNPQTLNEKLQWLKLYDRKPIYTKMVDKYEAKKYAADIIGKEYIIPTIGVWDKFNDINFNELPDQFVLKCTHDSGGVFICTDKNTFDIDAARKKINKNLKRNFYYNGREWPYKNVKPRIIAEKYMIDDKVNELRDYKWYTFDGVPHFMMINTGRAEHKTTADYFDMDFNHLDFTWGYPNFNGEIPKPKNYEIMKALAGKLAIGTKHLRVDFFDANGKIYFGELTFYDGSGFDKILPVEYDYKLGKLLDIPDIRESKNP